MSTTLHGARTALLQLASQFPAPSTYATQLAILSDYFDNQVPLSVENKALHQRITVLEACIDGVRGSLPADPSVINMPAAKAMNFIFTSGDKHALKTDTTRTPIDCSSWMGPGCACMACRVRANA